jgi:hypothetical protein
MNIRIIPNETGNPIGKLAEAELHFTEGPLAGTRLVGFAVWERRNAAGLNVTFPARVYTVNGERRSFALLRPQDGATAATALDAIRDAVLAAYQATVAPPPQLRADIIDTVTPDGARRRHTRWTADGAAAEDYPGQRITGPDYDTRDREGRDEPAETYRPEGAVLYDGTPGSASLPRRGRRK